ncbi:MAG: hypothetical protein ACXW0R_13795, partial [Gaiellaceae bacterium]
MERLPVSRAEVEPDLLASMLAGDLSEWPTDAWLAFDDFHAIAGTAPSERFVEALLLEAPLNVLLITRRRPEWASSRRILYGEISELNRETLAMTNDETRALLHGSEADAEGLMKLTQGWPAVLGLASISDALPPDLVSAPHLFSYFAHEVFRRLDPDAQRGLQELALYDVEGMQLALRLLEPDASERLVTAGIDHGFLAESSNGKLEMHPLLRSFLERKLESERPQEASAVVAQAVRTLIQHDLWDEAFALIQRFESFELVADLVASSKDRLLATGRTTTLRGWIATAPASIPIIRLAEAELALREAQYHESETLALLAARDLNNPDLVAAAYLVAGRAAHVASQEERAAQHYQDAGSASLTEELTRKAQLGELQASMELEMEDVPKRLSSLLLHQPLEPDDQVILADRKLGVESRY